ncbi:cystathionine beta-lyase [Streptococcus sp. S784/96/1]|uniref:cystathionine beta-lyase n=1 Tax=Streptococcus sp. S784/96/1 TaxID=2653499 RepID=UPI0013895B4D|nr:cystathionine beta-lyase [Streptococcus sp. S784/96/1]
MIDYMSLALTYGGFTVLDKVYLENKLAQLSDDDKLTFITPPPSVINAYFAELYQKESPEAATNYFFKMSQELKLYQENPSFLEEKPFVRLNLSGKSYGFVYESDEEIALVFSEQDEPVSSAILFELAQIFPHYKIYLQDGLIKMAKMAFSTEELENLTPESALLSHVTKISEDVIKVSSFNQEECLELVATFQGKKYFHYHQREFVVYIVQPNNDRTP